MHVRVHAHKRARRLAYAHAHRRSCRAELSATSIGHYCIGPLQTQNSFFGYIGHLGVIVAAPCLGLGKVDCPTKTLCALLTRDAYDCMRTEQPHATDLLHYYLARKRMDNLQKTVGNVASPKLVF